METPWRHQKIRWENCGGRIGKENIWKLTKRCRTKRSTCTKRSACTKPSSLSTQKKKNGWMCENAQLSFVTGCKTISQFYGRIGNLSILLNVCSMHWQDAGDDLSIQLTCCAPLLSNLLRIFSNYMWSDLPHASFFVSPTSYPLLSKLGSPTFGPLLFEAKKKK